MTSKAITQTLLPLYLMNFNDEQHSFIQEVFIKYLIPRVCTFIIYLWKPTQMKKIKSIIQQINAVDKSNKTDLLDLLWEVICYSPQWPLRNHQQQLLDQAEKFSLKVYDEHFSKKELNVNGFKWGEGRNKILLTHGWGSKGADFYELINVLKELKNVTVITFDAPGNGSSEGGLSSLILYAASVKAIVALYGAPEISIGHSLGSMANVIALKDTPPLLLISLSPLIRLKENFIASLTALNIPASDQETFFESFETRFKIQSSIFNMNDVYSFDEHLKHWLAYDDQDIIAPYPYLEEFLNKHRSVIARKFDNAGHERIIKDETVIAEIVAQVNDALTSSYL